MGLRAIWWEAGWDDFVAPGNDAAVSTCKEYAKNLSHRGLILTARNYGTGKSLLAACILKEVGGFWANCPELLDSIRASYDSGDTRMYDKSLTAKLLVLDDMGADRSNEWAMERFYILINTRYEHMRPVVITTNLANVKELESCYGGRTVDRIMGMCDVVQLKGQSYRRASKGA